MSLWLDFRLRRWWCLRARKLDVHFPTILQLLPKKDFQLHVELAGAVLEAASTCDSRNCSVPVFLSSIDVVFLSMRLGSIQGLKITSNTLTIQ